MVIFNFEVNSAVSLDRTKSQWIDLGIHTEACMTRPETCGAAGGAISLWVNVTDCPDLAGIVSSLGPGTGSVIFGYEEDIRYKTHIFTGRNEVLAKVIFSQACVCPQGGCSRFCSNFSGGALDFALIFWGGGSSKFLGEGSPPEYGQRSAGTHPTGMHSCYQYLYIS